MSNNKRRGLGRDLESLLGKQRPGSMTSTEPSLKTTPSSNKNDDLRQLALDMLHSGRYQPRKDITSDALSELADSIRSQGVIQPVVVRLIGDQQYEIIAGERRWRAAQLAGLETIPAIVRELDDKAASAMALIENVQRENLNPMEEAIAYHRLSEEFSLTHQQIANLIGKSRVAVSNILRLLNLNAEVKTFLEKGDIEMGHARALLGISGYTQIEAARKVVANKLSVRETEHFIRRLLTDSEMRKTKTVPDADIRHLQQNLAEKLGAKVQIHHGANGSGKLTIIYSSLDQLDGILEHIK